MWVYDFSFQTKFQVEMETLFITTEPLLPALLTELLMLAVHWTRNCILNC